MAMSDIILVTMIITHDTVAGQPTQPSRAMLARVYAFYAFYAWWVNNHWVPRDGTASS
jgi:hypothetical protein